MQQGAQLCFNGNFLVDRSEYPPLASRVLTSSGVAALPRRRDAHAQDGAQGHRSSERLGEDPKRADSIAQFGLVQNADAELGHFRILPAARGGARGAPQAGTGQNRIRASFHGMAGRTGEAEHNGLNRGTFGRVPQPRTSPCSRARHQGGTVSSNPVPSSRESATNRAAVGEAPPTVRFPRKLWPAPAHRCRTKRHCQCPAVLLQGHTEAPRSCLPAAIRRARPAANGPLRSAAEIFCRHS